MKKKNALDQKIKMAIKENIYITILELVQLTGRAKPQFKDIWIPCLNRER